jgi:hypothetical protein
MVKAHMDNFAIDNAIGNALSGNAILFLGAGIGAEAKNKLGQPIPNGSALSSILAQDLGFSEPNSDLSRVAQYYRRKKGAHTLKTILEQNLTITESSPRLTDFLQIPWRRIYTTNYDNLLKNARPRFKEFSHSDLPRGIHEGDHIFINGHLGLANLANLDTELVLTDWSYANSTFPDSQWAGFFRQDVNNCESIIFVGYSMRDLDITRVLISDPQTKSKVIIVSSDKTSEIDADILSSYGSVYPTGFDYVAARKKQVAKNYTRPETTHIFSSLHKIQADLNVFDDIAAAERLYSQFIYGNIDINFLLQEQSPIKPLIRRNAVEAALEPIFDGKLSDVMLVGGIGAGKTFSALDIAKTALGRKYEVFQVVNHRNLHADLQEAAKREKVIFIFDNYTRYLSEIGFLKGIRQPGQIVIYTSRTSIHELFENKLRTRNRSPNNRPRQDVVFRP